MPGRQSQEDRWGLSVNQSRQNGCQDLYLGELESDWNPKQELCQGETECLHCYIKDQPSEALGQVAYLTANEHACLCAV